jgi:hypothetical protein
MMISMVPPFAHNRIRAYEVEFGAGGQRLGCKFMLDDSTFVFVGESEITPEIESLMASLGSPTRTPEFFRLSRLGRLRTFPTFRI